MSRDRRKRQGEGGGRVSPKVPHEFSRENTFAETLPPPSPWLQTLSLLLLTALFRTKKMYISFFIKRVSYDSVISSC